MPALLPVALILQRVGRLTDPYWLAGDRVIRHADTLRGLFWIAELLTAGWLLFRGSSLPLGLALLAFMVLLHWSLPLSSLVVRPRALLGSALLLLVSSLLSLIMVEGAARLIYGPPHGDTGVLWRHHPIYQYLLNPGADTLLKVATSAGGTTDIQYNISDQGLRDRMFPPKEDGEYRVLLLGDSFTMGHAVNEECMISRQLEALLAENCPDRKITVINGGINGAGPLQELGMLRECGLPLHPDCVLLQLFLSNDLDNSLADVGKAQWTFNEAGRRTFDALRHQNSVPRRMEYWMRTRSTAYRTVFQATGFTPWISNILYALRITPVYETPVARAKEPNLHWALDVNRVHWYPELEEGLQLVGGHLAEMAAICREHSMDFAVWCMPSSFEVDLDRWNTLAGQAEEPAETFAPGTAIRRVEELLERGGIRTFSVLEVLRQDSRPIGSLYYLLDGHTTPEGNRVIAGLLAEFLLKTSLRESCACNPQP
ncbi:MAG: hypothetical protein H3C30_04760 [Candidatus Hydrogenedentes bacterium]|nr:hypothetical protein [Candidatus Hydrogenedentota bacterium]